MSHQQTFTFRVSTDLFAALPDACFGVVLARGVDNAAANPEAAAAMDAAVSSRAAELASTKVRESAVVAPYREAFRTLGINPNRFMCSIEALLTRIGKGSGLPHINTIVDLGNLVSITHQVPIGAHDVASTEGELSVRPAAEGDSFVPFGATEAEPVEAGEIVYAAGPSVRTRRWTWRQSELGKITEQTRDVLFPIDGFRGVNEDAVRAARDDLAERAGALGAEVQVGWVDAEHPEVTFD